MQGEIGCLQSCLDSRTLDISGLVETLVDVNRLGFGSREDNVEREAEGLVLRNVRSSRPWLVHIADC